MSGSGIEYPQIHDFDVYPSLGNPLAIKVLFPPLRHASVAFPSATTFAVVDRERLDGFFHVADAADADVHISQQS